MGVLDELLENSGGLSAIASTVASNPQILQAAMSLLSAKDTSVGGHGDTMASCLAGGPNKAISASQLGDVLGQNTISQFAAKAGINAGDASSVLAGLLPSLVNHITPQGQAPQGDALEGMLGSLVKGLAG